ncbi:MAG TPA: enoyl-CoA hydratase/isomerase family protein [Phenylobacterium sp.]
MSSKTTPKEGGPRPTGESGPDAGLLVAYADAGRLAAPEVAPGIVLLGVHRGGLRPAEIPPRFDMLLTTDPDPPRPWVGVAAGAIDQGVAELQAAVAATPVAAAVAAQVLRTSADLSWDAALVVESLAFSMLLGGAEFRAWRARTPIRPRGSDGRRLELSREAGVLSLTLARAEARNAVDARMRDQLVEALEFALVDPEAGPVVLRAEGPAFSAGGDLNEFGEATDPAFAHAIRLQQAPVRLARALGGRLTARLHGACIGAGIELPAAAARVVAAPDAWFRLPEVGMGLIPGAGGTVSIPRRIGRHRACFMAVSGRDIDVATALAWGLVDAVEPGAP